MSLKFLKSIKDKLFILCNPNEDELMIIPHKDEDLRAELNNIWELSFSINNLDINGDGYNNYYDLVVKDRIIKIQDLANFIITDCSESDNGISKTKNITCKSIEHEIVKKSLSYMECKAYKFYDTIPENIPNTFLGIILSYLPNWSISHIDTSLYNLYRVFDISSDTSIYNLMIEQAQSAYECIFQFDRLNKTISAYTRESILKNSDIFVSFENLAKEINIQPINDGLFTALRVRGANDMCINLVNPLGTDTIYNLDNVIDNIDNKTGIRLMSLDTSNAWKSWKNKYNTLSKDYANIILSIKEKKSSILSYKAKLSTIQAEIKAINTSISSFDKLSEDKTDLVNQYNAKISEEKTIQSNINSLTNEITSLETQLAEINSSLKFSNFFNDKQLKELDRFINITDFSDENFAITDSMTEAEIIDMTQELYKKAQRQLEILSKPRYSFDIDMLCPFFAENFEVAKEQLDFGTKITLQDSSGNIYEPFLIGISFSFDNLNSVKFTFSESLRNQSNDFKISQLLGKTNSVATNLAMNNLKYKSYIDSGDKETLHKMRSDALNADLQELINSSNKTIVFDDCGILCRSLDKDGTNGYSKYQSRLNDKGLFFTNDYWKHLNSAFGWLSLPNGLKTFAVNTDVLWGDIVLTENLKLYNANNSFTVDENGATLTNADFSLITNNGLNKILISPKSGFRIQSKAGTKYNDVFYIDTDGQLVSKSLIKGGSINIGNRFKVNTDGTVEMASGTLKSFQSLMSNGKGLKVENGVTTIDGDCEISGNTVISGNLTLGGNIKWDSHDPNITVAQESADGAYSSASKANRNINKLSNGEFIGGTFISGTCIKSPEIRGGKVVGGELIVDGNINSDDSDNKKESGQLTFTNGDTPYGHIRYDNTGKGKDDKNNKEAKERMFIVTDPGKALKIQSGGDMSLEAGTNCDIYIMSNIKLGSNKKIFNADGTELSSVAKFG